MQMYRMFILWLFAKDKSVIETKQAETREDGVVDVATEVKKVCAACGYDLTPEELAADTCADCGAELNISQHVSLHVTSVPSFTIMF